VEEKLDFLRSIKPAIANLRIGVHMFPGTPIAAQALAEGPLLQYAVSATPPIGVTPPPRIKPPSRAGGQRTLQNIVLDRFPGERRDRFEPLMLLRSDFNGKTAHIVLLAVGRLFLRYNKIYKCPICTFAA
jgi:hypothetical protein